MNFPEWEMDNNLPDGLEIEHKQENAVVISHTWKGETIRRARLCEFEVNGKFSAETLVIYPNWSTSTPIFGTEYIMVADKKYFGAIDFHPLSQDPYYLISHVDEYLYDFPRRTIEDSKFYDLTTFFSDRSWIRKESSDFYQEYLDWVDRYLGRYRMALFDGKTGEADNRSAHMAYDAHMAENDPAHGILKAYFSEDFADYYVNKFLFDLSKA